LPIIGISLIAFGRHATEAGRSIIIHGRPKKEEHVTKKVFFSSNRGMWVSKIRNFTLISKWGNLPL
jgi:hypothetical protein